MGSAVGVVSGDSAFNVPGRRGKKIGRLPNIGDRWN
jgi:hypothetical protein